MEDEIMEGLEETEVGEGEEPSLEDMPFRRSKVRGKSSLKGKIFPPKLLENVVKIFVTKVPAKYDTPWKKGTQKSCTGSGFCIEGRLIITNAHVVHQHTVVRVRRSGNAVKYAAKVCYSPWFYTYVVL
jgi:S1-C subfamily serine protease